MKIYTASIDHEHGTNYYVGLTMAQLKKEVAEFCREYWEEEMKGKEMPEDEEEQISQYFDTEHGAYQEFLTYGESILEAPGTPFKELTEEQAREKTELCYFETESGFHIGLDFTYIDQVGDFKIVLPTGEIIDTSMMEE